MTLSPADIYHFGKSVLFLMCHAITQRPFTLACFPWRIKFKVIRNRQVLQGGKRFSQDLWKGKTEVWWRPAHTRQLMWGNFVCWHWILNLSVWFLKPNTEQWAECSTTPGQWEASLKQRLLLLHTLDFVYVEEILHICSVQSIALQSHVKLTTPVSPSLSKHKD